MPHPLDSLGDTDIVGLERVQSYAEGDGADTEGPVGSRANLGDTLLGEVVDNTRPACC